MRFYRKPRASPKASNSLCFTGPTGHGRGAPHDLRRHRKCIKCKYMDCVEVCPVDCFYEGENMLVIHPDECIDCGVCEPECPAEAIEPTPSRGWRAGLSSMPNMPPNGRISRSSANLPLTPKSGTAFPTSSSSSSRRKPGRAIERGRHLNRRLTARADVSTEPARHPGPPRHKTSNSMLHVWPRAENAEAADRGPLSREGCFGDQGGRIAKK